MADQDRTPVPRYRPFAGPVLFAHGFRPFFLAAGLWAPLALAGFLAMLAGWIAVPSIPDPIGWHWHEMLFGFVAAAMAGFALTAIPNWTGRLPLQGVPLMLLFGLWLAGRAAMAAPAVLGGRLAAAIDLGFLLVLAALILREILAGRNWRNLPVVLAVGLFALANGLSHAESLGLMAPNGLGQRLGIAIAVMLIMLIGGRIIPSFTHNWLMKQGTAALPAPFGAFDRAVLLASLAALGLWVGWPDGAMTAPALGLAAVLNGLRLLRWQGHRTAGEALLWVLHAGYAWIPAGLGLLAAGAWWPLIGPAAALHALTAGAMGMMVLAVMSRATLGHTGRPLVAGPVLCLAFLSIGLAALARVLSVLFTDHYAALLHVAGFAWVAAFALFLVRCGPMLLAPRADKA